LTRCQPWRCRRLAAMFSLRKCETQVHRRRAASAYPRPCRTKIVLSARKCSSPKLRATGFAAVPLVSTIKCPGQSESVTPCAATSSVLSWSHLPSQFTRRLGIVRIQRRQNRPPHSLSPHKSRNEKAQHGRKRKASPSGDHNDERRRRSMRRAGHENQVFPSSGWAKKRRWQESPSSRVSRERTPKPSMRADTASLVEKGGERSPLASLPRAGSPRNQLESASTNAVDDEFPALETSRR